MSELSTQLAAAGREESWPLAAGPLAPLARAGSVVFGAAVALRGLARRFGLIRAERAGRPVISVGNITAGGTGKTPLTILLARRLEARGLHVAVLSRGYGAPDPPPRHTPLVVSERGNLLAGAEQAGDEPVLIARKTSGSVVVCRDRRLAARVAVDRLGAGVLLLDDGFQHWRLARDLDILVLDARAPFGNGRLLPAGPLREPRRAASRADLIVLNHGAVRDGPVEALVGGSDISARVSVAAVPDRLERVGDAADRLGAEWLSGRKIALLCGIARPERFARTADRLGAIVVHRDLRRDHAWLSAAGLARASMAARDAGAEIVLTTEKDAARIPHAALDALELPLYALVLDMAILSGEAALDDALDRVLSRPDAR